MKASIITVCRNSSLTIADTLDSVAGQTYRDIEHIIVDGCSTDDTLNIVRRFSNGSRNPPRVVSEPDDGIYDAMNKGVLMAKGDVIAFLNADDVYASSTVVARVVDVMSRQGLDALYGDVLFFRPTDTATPVRRYSSRRFSPERLAWGLMPAHPTLFLRRQIFERLGGFRTDYRIAGDFEFVARAFAIAELRYRYLPEILVHMRTGGVSTGGLRNTLLLNREVLRACRANGIKTNVLKVLSKYPSKILEFLP